MASLFASALIVVTGWLAAEPAASAPSSCPYSGGGPPFALQSFEADKDRQLYLDTLQLAATNRLFPDDEDFQLPTLTVGVDHIEDSEAAIPPQLLYAVAWIESKIAQAPWEVDWNSLGPPLLSPDCGYGIMQITSTIHNDGGLPSRYEALVGAHFAYNIAAGARILAEKWNDAFYPLVGDRDPRYLESWYYALWAYNGWAGINHPDNPAYDPARPPYDCDPDRSDWHEYPYQEKVLGCVANPPEVDGQRLWEPLPVSLPDLTIPPLDIEVFYTGLDTIYAQIDASPFAEMNLPLPSAAQLPTLDLAGASRAHVLGQPDGRLDTDRLELTSSQLRSGAVALLIHNDGSGLLAWRIVDAPGWLSIDIQAGVALGAPGYGNGPQPSRLSISAAADGVPEGAHRGRITLEFHDPDGGSETRTIAVSLDKQGAAVYQAGRPES